MEVISRGYKIPGMDHKFALWKFQINIDFLTQNAKQQEIQPKLSQFNQQNINKYSSLSFEAPQLITFNITGIT
jgi:hypothetical protein